MAPRILVVDADPATVSWLSAKLETEGYAVSAIDNGDAAWQSIVSAPPDVIVLDPTLPDMDGLALVRRVRQDPRYSGIGIVILSRRAEPDDILAGLNAGADHYIRKRPGGDVELIAKIRAQLAQPRKVVAPTAVKRGRVFSFCSGKGGTGTTSVCVNTAYALAALERGAEIVVVDMVFPMGTVALSLGYESPKTVARLTNAVKDQMEPTLVEKFVSQPLRWGFRVLIGANDPQEASNLNVAQVLPLFETLKTMYDYVLVDFGRTLSRISLPVIEMSNGIIVIVTPDISTVRATRTVVEYLEKHDIEPSRLILINNRTVGRVWTTVEDIEREVKLPLNATVPYELEHMTMAINAASPFMAKFPNNSACMTFQDLARLLIERGKKAL